VAHHVPLVSQRYNSLINYLILSTSNSVIVRVRVVLKRTVVFVLFTHRCGENARTVYLKEGHWGGDFNGRLVTYYCPPNYCRCVTEGDLPGCIFNPDHIDNQCDHNRTGVLCGKCKEGLTVGLRLVQNIYRKSSNKRPGRLFQI